MLGGRSCEVLKRFSLALGLVLVFLTAAAAFADFQTAVDAYNAGDYDTAYTEWLPLAEKGSAAAQFNIGLLHDEGAGRERDLEQAILWYVRSAENGFGRAQFRLGELYETGDEPLERDLIQARKWFAIAAESRFKGAKKRMKAVAKRMTEGEIALGDLWAREFLRDHRSR
jgi:TPR repeat protein